MIRRHASGRTAHRRSTGKVKSNALIGRLRWDRRGGRIRDRNFVELTPERVNRSLKRPGVRLALLGVFAVALGIGAATSEPVVQLLERTYQQAPVRLGTIAVQGNRHLSAAEVALASGLARQAPVAGIDRSQVVASLEMHPWILRAEALYLPAGRLLVSIEERVPFMAIGSPEGEAGTLVWHLVDRDGVAFAIATPDDLPGLPRLRSDRAPILGERDPRLVEAIAVTDRFPTLALVDESPATPQALELPSDGSEAGWVLHFESPQRRVLLGRDSLEKRLERLALLLAADLEATRAAEVIDLRFADRAILRGASASE